MDGSAGIGGTRTEVLAHRGYHATGVSENSIGAFEAALALGADRLELDVRQTRDGVLVIFHDKELADGRKLSEVDFAQLPTLPDGQPIPTLVDVAELARARNAKLAVEFKEDGFEQLALSQLLSRMPREHLEVISFDRDSIRLVEDIDPLIRTGLLEPRIPGWLRDSPFYGAARWFMDTFDWHPSLGAAAKVGADYVSVEERMVTPDFLAAAKEQGIGVTAWTVDDPARMRELFDAGLQGVVTDRPDLALQVRDQARVGAELLAA